MPTYKNLSDFTDHKLWVISSGWFNPTYSLTDGENEYGSIYHEGLFSSTTILETSSIRLAASGAANGDIILKSSEGKIIGYAGTALVKPGLSLTLNNGLTATLSQPDIWHANYVWNCGDGSCMMQVDGNIQLSLIFSCSKPLSDVPHFLLLLFSAVKYLIYMNTNVG
jgi:hypothetical protein